jgi:hypothetical protein
MQRPTQEQLERMERAERFERYRLPLLFFGMVLVVMMSRFDGTRRASAALASYGFPVAMGLAASVKFMDSRPSLQVPAYALAAIAALSADLAVLAALRPEGHWLHALPPKALPAVLVACTLAGAVVQGRAADAGLPTYLSAWLGMIAMWGLYFPSHAAAGSDPFGAVLAAGMVSLFVGGGAGFALGALAKRMIKR